MITREKLYEYAMVLYDFCEYPAVRYKILFSLLDTPYNDKELSVLHNEFLWSDIVEEMYQLQWDNGGWGYFGYFSCNRHYKHNRVVDCTMEILSFLKQYIEHNS